MQSKKEEMNGDFLEHYFTNNTNLKSEMRQITYENGNTVFTFWSDLRVFSKNHIDYGSKLLVETILEKKNKKNLKILDVGCGYGFIGIVLAKLLKSEVTMVDVNKRAVHLCEKNRKENQVEGICLESNIYENVTGKFDLVVTNPPIRAGKSVVLEMLEKAKEYMNEEGELWFVIRKDQGVKSISKVLEKTYKVEKMATSKGFYVMCAKSC